MTFHIPKDWDPIEPTVLTIEHPKSPCSHLQNTSSTLL